MNADTTDLPRITRWNRADSLICVLLVLGALLVRLPELLTLPAFRDELAEVVRGLHIYRGVSYPLTNEALDIGALFNYMVALLFATTGPDPYTPRLLVAMIGAATVALTYALAWRLTASRLAATVAAGLLATNSMHILISHISWSNCTTPFWTTAVLLALASAQPNRLPRGWMLILAGLLAGLALQSHSSVIAFLVGIGVWLWWPARGLLARLRRPAFWGAHLAFLLAYANMIVFNIANPLASWYHVVEHKSYALAGADAVGHVGIGNGYFDNLGALFVEWLRANSADFAEHAQLFAYLADPVFIVYGLLFIAGSVLAVRRKLWLLLAPAVAIALILPLFNRDYQFEIHSRYIGFLLPIGAVLMALPFAALARWVGSKAASRSIPGLRPSSLAPLYAPFAVAALLVFYPLLPLRDYYAGEMAAGRSNTGVINTLGLLEPMRDGGAAAFTNKLPLSMSIGLGLDVWSIPHLELNDTNEPTLPPGEGGLDTPAVWHSFLEWAKGLPPGTNGFTVALPPAGAAAWRSIGGALPWQEVGNAQSSDGQPVATVLRLPLSAAALTAQPDAQLKTDLMVIVPSLSNALGTNMLARISAAQAAGARVRVVALDGTEQDADASADLGRFGLTPDRLLRGGYPTAYLGSIAPGSTTTNREAPWTDPAGAVGQTIIAGQTTIHQRLFGKPGVVSAATLRADLRGLAVLYAPVLILAPSPTSADPVLATTGVQATYAAKKAGVPIETLP